MSDVFPPARQREALLALREALGARDNSLRRDECGDWAIFGKNGHIYATLVRWTGHRRPASRSP
jgi:hypothetical protein